MICPFCNGELRITIFFALHSDGHEEPVKSIDCYHCNATGQVDDRYPEWLKRGARMKESRMVPLYHNLRQVSDLLGFSVTDLSRMERGLDDPTPYEEAWRKVRAPTLERGMT